MANFVQDGLLESPERSKVSYAQDEQPVHLLFHWLDHRVNDADYMINTHQTSTLDANSGVGMITETNTTDWMDTRHVPFDNRKYCSEYSMFDQDSLVGNPLGPDSSLTVSQMQRFSIREISPEWAYTTGNTKVYSMKLI